jgi:hypothetical protein
MTDFSLTLGPVAFAGFELPSSITLGGRQRLAIHRLPGGVRIIDALGPDPADLGWSGIFSGPDAADRARLLDTMRVAGVSMVLAWDAFLYTVIIQSFAADYRSPWWIPYRLSCAVLQDEAAVFASAVPALGPDLAADLSAAAPYTAAATLALSSAGATTAGSAAYVAASATLASTVAGLNDQITATEPTLQAADVPTAAAACGLLAQLTAALAYTARAARNLADAST